MRACSLQQVEFLSTTDGRPPIVHPKFAVNILGVGSQGAQRHHQLAGNFRAVQFGSEQSEHFQFAFAEWLNQRRWLMIDC